MNAQLTMNLNTDNAWAFAVKRPARSGRSLRRTGREVRDYIISASSIEARRLGVRSGMHYAEAKKLIPHIRVILIGEGRRKR